MGKRAPAPLPSDPPPAEVDAMIPDVVFTSWDEFKSTFCNHLFRGEAFRRGRYLFRGHSDPNWALSSTFDRMFADQPRPKRLQLAEGLLAFFKKGVEGITLPAEVRGDDSQLMALGQHFGLPTRLLDWTESPYIAAFFAYNNSALWGARDQQIAIWTLDSTNPIWSSHFGVEIVEVSSFGNDRIRNQSGKFTMSKTPFATLEEYVAAHGDIGMGGDGVDVPLRKFLLPAADATRALADLDAMGIHHGTVYPEIEGAAQMAIFRTVSHFNAFVQTTSTPRPA